MTRQTQPVLRPILCLMLHKSVPLKLMRGLNIAEVNFSCLITTVETMRQKENLVSQTRHRPAFQQR
jgi:hypothetical protein